MPPSHPAIVTFTAVEHHCLLAGTKLYCLVTQAHGREQLAYSYYSIASTPEVKATTAWLKVQRPNRNATKSTKQVANRMKLITVSIFGFCLILIFLQSLQVKLVPKNLRVTATGPLQVGCTINNECQNAEVTVKTDSNNMSLENSQHILAAITLTNKYLQIKQTQDEEFNSKHQQCYSYDTIRYGVCTRKLTGQDRTCQFSLAHKN